MNEDKKYALDSMDQTPIEKTPDEKIQSLIETLIPMLEMRNTANQDKIEFPNVIQVSPTMVIMNTDSNTMIRFLGDPIAKGKYTFTRDPDIKLDYQMRVYIKDAIKRTIEDVFPMSCAYELPPDTTCADIACFKDSRGITVRVGLSKTTIDEFNQVYKDNLDILFPNGIIDADEIKTESDEIIFMRNALKLAFYRYSITYIPVLRKGKTYNMICRINNQDEYYTLTIATEYED